MGIQPRTLYVPKNFAERLNHANVYGAAYILLGAHKRGGRVIQNAMKEHGLNFQQSHIIFDENQKVELYIRMLRDDITLLEGATMAFTYIVKIFDEIMELDK